MSFRSILSHFWSNILLTFKLVFFVFFNNLRQTKPTQPWTQHREKHCKPLLHRAAHSPFSSTKNHIKPNKQKKNPIFLNMCSNRQDPGESLPIWQVVPSHWGGHKHSNPSSLSMQVPPPAHGLDAHSSKSDKTQVCELQAPVSTLGVNVEEKTHCWHRSDPPIRTDTGTRTLLEPRGTFLRWHRG